MSIFTLFASRLAVLAESGSGAGAQTSICADASSSNLHPRYILNGRHLILGDENWAPYNTFDKVNSKWEGYNSDLIDQISLLLGFTFEIRDFRATAPTDVWSVPAADGGGRYNAYLRGFAERRAAQAELDLLLSYWTVNTYRRSVPNLLMLSPHAQGSTPLLVTNSVDKNLVIARPELPFTSAIRVALMPFTGVAWGVLAAIVALSTVVLAFLEWQQDDFESARSRGGGCLDALSISFFLSTMLVAQAGGHVPRTRLGGMFMGFFSLFIFMVVIVYGSVLTAGLTTASINHASQGGITSLTDLIASGNAACIRANDGNRRRLRNQYASTGLKFDVLENVVHDGVTIDGDVEMLRRMRAPRSESERCHAAVVTSGVYGKWTAAPVSTARRQQLDLLTAAYGLTPNQTLLSSLASTQCGKVNSVDSFDSYGGKTASWVTRTDTTCVQRAFEWALAHLYSEGSLAQLEARWFNTYCRQAPPPTPGAEADEPVASIEDAVAEGGSAWIDQGAVGISELSGICFFWAVGTALTVVGLSLGMGGKQEYDEQKAALRRQVSRTGTAGRSVSRTVSRTVSRSVSRKVNRKATLDALPPPPGLHEHPDDEGLAAAGAAAAAGGEGREDGKGGHSPSALEGRRRGHLTKLKQSPGRRSGSGTPPVSNLGGCGGRCRGSSESLSPAEHVESESPYLDAARLPPPNVSVGTSEGKTRAPERSCMRSGKKRCSFAPAHGEVSETASLPHGGGMGARAAAGVAAENPRDQMSA